MIFGYIHLGTCWHHHMLERVLCQYRYKKMVPRPPMPFKEGIVSVLDDR